MTDQTEETPVLTRAAYDRLKAELDHLTTEGRKGVAERLLRARELGDLRENAEYDETKNEQGLMEARIRYIEGTLKRAKVIEGPVEADEVVPGMLVTLRNPDDPDDTDVYLIAASSEERAKGARTVTVKSPLGQAVVGSRVGDRVTYEAPGGAFTYEVVDFKPWDGN